MNRRFIPGLLIVLLGLKVIIVAPGAVAADDDCPSQMSQMGDECPCCPTGLAAADCATMCAAMCATIVAHVTTTTPTVVLLEPMVSVPFVVGAIFSQTYPPLDPPPIR